MNESTPKKKRKLLLPALIAVGALLVVGFLISQAGLDKVIVKNKLDEVIASVKEAGRAQGNDIEITYKDITVTGSLLNKQIIVQEPTFRVRPVERDPKHDPKKIDSIILSTPEMIIYPKSADLSSATYSLPKPLNLAGENEPEKSLLHIEQSSPIEVTLTQTIENNVTHLKTSHVPPASLKLTYLKVQQAMGVEDETPEVTPVYQTMTVNIGEGSSATSDFALDDSGTGAADVVYKTITLVPEVQPEGAITVAGLESHWSNTLNEKGLNVIVAKATLGPITADPSIMPHTPITLNLDFSFEGPMAKANEQEPTGEPRDSLIILKKFEFTNKDSGIVASGNFTATPSDILPVGAATVKVTNLPLILDALRTNQIVTSNNEKWILPVLEKIGGSPIANLKDMDVAVNRERGGAFVIGNSTFEELFAIMLKGAMNVNAPASDNEPPATEQDLAPQTRSFTPQLPSPDKPRLAPIEVPDNGVRG